MFSRILAASAASQLDGSGVNQFTEPAIDEMDRVFLVSTPDLPALHRAGQIAEYFTEKRTPRVDVHLILNRVPIKKKFRFTTPDAARLWACRSTVRFRRCRVRGAFRGIHRREVGRTNYRVGKDFSEAARMIARLSSGEQQRPPFSLSTGWLRSATSSLR